MTRRAFLCLLMATPALAMTDRLVRAESVDVAPLCRSDERYEVEDGNLVLAVVCEGVFHIGKVVTVWDGNRVVRFKVGNLWSTANGRTVLCGMVV